MWQVPEPNVLCDVRGHLRIVELSTTFPVGILDAGTPKALPAIRSALEILL